MAITCDSTTLRHQEGEKEKVNVLNLAKYNSNEFINNKVMLSSAHFKYAVVLPEKYNGIVSFL